MAATLKSYFGFGSTAPKEQEKKAVRALPSSWYTSPEMYELERRAIFSRKWLITTHKMRLKEPGDWLRYNIAGFDIVVARDRGGNVNAFHNVCRHRAYPVVEGQKGTAKIFACRYHGWSYGLNGKLAKAPGYQDLPGFDKTQNSLLPIHVHVDVNGFIWINMDAKEKPEIPWEEDFNGVDTQERYSAFNFDDYEFDHSWEIDAKYNWKIAADNYNECYHCKTTHPGLPAVADLESYDAFPTASFIRHDAATTDEQKEAGRLVACTYYFPHASTNVTPHFFFMQKFQPRGPGSSNILYEVYRNKNSTEEDFGAINEIYKRVMTEDEALCTQAQKNLNAGIFINGELHPHMEKGPLFFQSQVREIVTKFHQREQVTGHEIWPARQNLPATALASNDDVEFCKGLTCGDKRDSLVW